MRQSIAVFFCGLLFMTQAAQAGEPPAEESSVTESSSAGEAAAPSADAPNEEASLSAAADAPPQVVIKRRVEPQWPWRAWGWKPIDETCIARIDADIEGVPYNVVVSGCSETFHTVTEKAALQYRLYPLLVDGVPQEVTTAVKMTFHRD